MRALTFPKKLSEQMRKLLTNKEKQLKARKEALQAEDPFADPNRLNDNAAIDAEAAEQFGHERVEAIRKEVDKALINVRKALTKLKWGKYGICEDCRKMIETERLAIDPTASRCVKCQTKYVAPQEGE